eukprot:9463570-Lingulodinium_polyedra.AAC.1
MPKIDLCVGVGREPECGGKMAKRSSADCHAPGGTNSVAAVGLDASGAKRELGPDPQQRPTYR